ncbi:tetratricopeptide repeat-containing hybrid sensor histidine kinase/response regulator [Algibacter pacificus]|uniref:tetratricopeptide repeat-containing hybrid sensor histidine kinase/response regulator n=1 Tax=Algibacter pacificus TaxID=2599389 RepID=UPI0011CA377F|nr:response regulator [Algibacter pacificus]
MPAFKPFILILTTFLSIVGLAQNTPNTNRELIQNNINYHLKQAQHNLNNNTYYEALKNLDAALAQAQKANLQKDIALIYAFKGKLELNLNEPNNAITSLNKAIKIQDSIDDPVNLAKSFQTLGLVNLKNKSFQKALNYFTTSKTLFKNVDLEDHVAEALLLEGRTFILLEEYKKAKIALKEAIILATENNELTIKTEALINMAITCHNLGYLRKGLEYAKEGLHIATINNFTSKRNEAYLTLSNITNTLRKYKDSRAYLKAYLDLSDSIRNLKKEKRINTDQELNTSFLEVKEELSKTNEKLKMQEIENNRKTLISFLSFALITILSLLTFLLYKNNNIRLKTNVMLHKKNGELLLAKEKAELASKTKANFLSTVTHELRTPLYAVTGLSTMLLEENPKPEQIQHLKSLKFSGDHLLTFINDILQINKIEANKLDLDPTPFNLYKKINNIILALENSAQDNNNKISLEYDKELPENFIADQLKLSQILINLIGNSIKFTKDGNIWIKAYKINKIDKIYTVGFEVKDNGIGISKEKQAAMFESFSQGSIQINRKYGGTGLGLYIVKGLISILKGTTFIKSELGKGTSFFFEIPMEYNDGEIINEKEVNYFNTNKEDIDLEKIKILVVEDNKINQMITKKILAKMGLNCDVVDNGEDAVEMVKEREYHIVLMDIHMPGISGIEATKRIRKFDKTLTIFALTAVTIEDKMQEFQDAEFTDIIPKPFKQEEFQKKLYLALSEKKEL